MHTNTHVRACACILTHPFTFLYTCICVALISPCMQDGVNPSDGLSINHSRKSNVVYWSFSEFGHKYLCMEQAWFCMAVVRSHALIHEVQGGVTQLTTKLLLQLFQPRGHDLQTTGVSFTLHGDDQRVTLFAKMGTLVSDEPAIKA